MTEISWRLTMKVKTYLTTVLDTSLPLNKTFTNADQFCISVRLCFSGLKQKDQKQINTKRESKQCKTIDFMSPRIGYWLLLH